MKKILICAILLLLCVVSGCKSKTETDDEAVTTTAPVSISKTSPTGTLPTLPAGALSCERSGDTVTVTVTLTECAGQAVSLLALSDSQYQYTWSENSEVLSDIGQITLDGQGKGSLVLKLKNGTDSVCIILTAASGSYISEVN